MKVLTRSEQEVFSDLADLCQKPGYVHALAYLSFRDNVILYQGHVQQSDLEKSFSPSRLIRTEITTLMGLMVKGAIDWGLPSPRTLQSYSDKTESLLEELHHCLSGEFFHGITKEALESGSFDPFDRGAVLREPIFYSGEAAYSFQYLDLAISKYAADAPWLEANKGFKIEHAVLVAKTIETLHVDHFDSHRVHTRRMHPDEWTMLPIFSFSVDEVVVGAGLSRELVVRVLEAFELPGGEQNKGFEALNDFNAITATPLLRMPCGDYLSLQGYSLAEAIYESPFFWMAQDKGYLPALTKNRGDFTENFAGARLSTVFGKQHVHMNVDIVESKAAKKSEIDVLVVWGDRIIIVQAKSKRLTLEARKGNDQVIRDDFKKAVQAAYVQAVECAKSLLNNGYKQVVSNGTDVELPEVIKEVYLFCVVSDHYPALSFQSRQFLQTEVVDRVQAPLVMDVFALDAMTEMLESPLRFLSYANRRANFAEQVMASQELTILGYHLSRNLWVEQNINLMQLADDFSSSLDIAMMVRRTGLGGAATPDGVLTRVSRTLIGRIVKEIESHPVSPTIELGFQLLALSEQAVVNISRAVDRLAGRSRSDGKLHDATFVLEDGPGITFHCTNEPASIAGPRLEAYCSLRKYKQKTNQWFGLCLSPNGPSVRFGVTLTSPWIQNDQMDVAAQELPEPMQVEQALSSLMRGRCRVPKIGRNDQCPCGSGRKYKKCCLT